MTPRAQKNSTKAAPQEITLPVYNMDGKQIETITLDNHVFDGVVNSEAVYQAVNGYRANQRKGLASTKTRGEVSGGGKKPWKQKGTGRARVGSIRSPLWRHGGVVFGPHPRDFAYSIPQKIRAVALKSSLNSKAHEGNIVVLDELKIAQPKTKEAFGVFRNLKLAVSNGGKENGSVLLLIRAFEPTMKLALRNIDFVAAVTAKDVNCYDVLSRRKLVVTKDGLKDLSERLHQSARKKTAARREGSK